MKKLDLGQSIGLLANIGVIAGIVFLGYELRQNNLNIQETARYNIFQNRLTSNLLIATDPEMARFRYWQESDGPLSELDDRRRTALIQTYFLRWDNDFQSYLSGTLEYENLGIDGIRANWAGISGMEEVWQARKEGVSADFAQWVDENLVNDFEANTQ